MILALKGNSRSQHRPGWTNVCNVELYLVPKSPIRVFPRAFCAWTVTWFQVVFSTFWTQQDLTGCIKLTGKPPSALRTKLHCCIEIVEIAEIFKLNIYINISSQLNLCHWNTPFSHPERFGWGCLLQQLCRMTYIEIQCHIHEYGGLDEGDLRLCRSNCKGWHSSLFVTSQRSCFDSIFLVRGMWKAIAYDDHRNKSL